MAAATDLPAERARYLDWIREGLHGEMRWITADHARRSSDPRLVLADARSVVCVGMAYRHGGRPADGPQSGRIARYAWGRDYHAVLGERLQHLVGMLEKQLGGRHSWYVDTGPLMDKALAARAGLGWYGKNTNILSERFGSFVLLGDIITSLELAPDRPLGQTCGSCRLCVVACPTGALGPEYTIDSRKCISYLTIEHRGPIPRELRPLMGNWVFGCDICQDVCPPSVQPHLKDAAERRAWAAEVRQYISSSQAPGGEPGPRASSRQTAVGPVPHRPAVPPPRVSSSAQTGANETSQVPSRPLFENGVRHSVDLLWLLQLTHTQYVEAFRGSAIKRAKDWMLRRNAAVALGNVGNASCLEALARTMRSDEHPIVRGHAAWGTGRLAERLGQGDQSYSAAEHVLGQSLAGEEEEQVREELRWALSRLSLRASE